MQSTNRWVAVLLIVALLGLFLWMVRSVLMPVALGGLFAVILAPLHVKLADRLGKRRRFSTPLITGGALLLIVMPLVVAGTMAVRSLKDLFGERFADSRHKLSGTVAHQLNRLSGFLEPFGVDTSPEALRHTITEQVQEVGRSLAEGMGTAVAKTPALLIGIFLFVLALFFFLRDGERLMMWCSRALPFRAKDTEELFGSVRDAVRGVVLGSILTGLLQSTLTLVSLLVFSVPGAFLWALVAFVLSFIPVVGTVPVTAGATLFLVLDDRHAAGIAMAVCAVLIGTSDNLVRPLAQDAQSHMHPLLTLLAIFGGLQAMGTGGLFVGPVIAAMVVWSIQTYAAWRQQESAPPA